MVAPGEPSGTRANRVGRGLPAPGVPPIFALRTVSQVRSIARMRDKVIRLFNAGGIRPVDVFDLGEPDADGYTNWIAVYRDADGLQEAAVAVRQGADGVEFDVQQALVIANTWDLGAPGLARAILTTVGSTEGLTDDEAETMAALAGVAAEQYAWAREAATVPQGELLYRMERGYTIAEVAESLHISQRQIKRYTADGRLKCLRIGGRVVILDRHLEEFYETFST